MTTVIRDLFRLKSNGSLNRPDFVVLPDSSIGTYARPAFGEDSEVNGFAHVVIVELKKPGIKIAADEMNQAGKYARELKTRGAISLETKVTGFVLGTSLDPISSEQVNQGSTTITAMTYEAFIRRAEARMLNLYEKLKDSPFLAEAGIDSVAFTTPQQPDQQTIL